MFNSEELEKIGHVFCSGYESEFTYDPDTKKWHQIVEGPDTINTADVEFFQSVPMLKDFYLDDPIEVLVNSMEKFPTGTYHPGDTIMEFNGKTNAITIRRAAAHGKTGDYADEVIMARADSSPVPGDNPALDVVSQYVSPAVADKIIAGLLDSGVI